MTDWDPIGVADEPDAQDEYDSYIEGIYQLLQKHCSAADLIEHLYNIQTKYMGLWCKRTDLEPVAHKLHALRAKD